jgi:hypothetical protein
VKIKQLLKGILFGILFVLVLYALLPEDLRFSRVITLLVSISVLIFIPILRYILHFSKIPIFKLNLTKKLRFIIVSSLSEANKIVEILNQNINKPEIIGFVSINEKTNSNFLGSISQLSEINKIHKPDEIIFSAKDISSQDIIKNILILSETKVTFRIASPDSLTVVGSKSLDTQGNLYSFDFNTITLPINKRLKRIFDISFSIFLIITLPINLFFVHKKNNYLKNIAKVLFGIKSWVGYSSNFDKKLPKIKNGIVSLSDVYNDDENQNKIEKYNLNYAKDYKIYYDFFIVFKTFSLLGNK